MDSTVSLKEVQKRVKKIRKLNDNVNSGAAHKEEGKLFKDFISLISTEDTFYGALAKEILTTQKIGIDRFYEY